MPKFTSAFVLPFKTLQMLPQGTNERQSQCTKARRPAAKMLALASTSRCLQPNILSWASIAILSVTAPAYLQALELHKNTARKLAPSITLPQKPK